MATGKSGSIPVTTSNQYISGYIGWSETYDIATNTSSVTAALYLKRTNTGYTTEGQSEFVITINGNSHSSSGYKYIYSGTYTNLVSHTVTVPHNADGTKSISISAYGYIYTNTMSLQSGTAVLTTIPRASTITAPSGTLGENLIIKVNRASSSFTHTITYSCSGRTGTIVSKGSNTSITWSVPNTLADNAPTSKTLSCEFTITTYNGNTQIGSSQTSSVTLNVPNDQYFQPDFTLNPIDIVNQDLVSGWDECIKGFSKLHSSVTNITYKHGANAGSIKLSSSNGYSSTTSELTANVTSTGLFTITATVTDSRGYSKTKSVTFDSIVDYAPPVILEANVVRCLQDGTESINGTYLKVNLDYSYSTVGDNEIESSVLLYRLAGSGDDFTNGGTVIDGETIIGHGQFNIAASYDVQIAIEDTLSGNDTYDGFISTSECIFNIKNTGNGAAFGKYSEYDNLLDINWNLRTRGNLIVDGSIGFSGEIPIESGGTGARTAESAISNLGIGDFITETGTSGIWKYQKWYSGKAECWGMATINGIRCNNSWGSMYESQLYGPIDYPFEFIERPLQYMQVNISGIYSYFIETPYGANYHNTIANTGSWYMVRPTQNTTADYAGIDIHVIGRWK